MATYLVELWDKPGDSATSKTEEVEADAYVIEPSGALTFTNQENTGEGYGSMVLISLVKAFSPWSWASIVKVPEVAVAPGD